MKYNNPELISILSAEYVLGTLRGPARQRFKKLMIVRPDVREAVLVWEEYFAVLNSTEKPSEVPDRIWSQVSKTLFDKGMQSKKKQSVWGRWGVTAGLASMALSALLVLNSQWFIVSDDQSTYVSIFQDDNKEAIWSVSIRPDEKSIAVTPINVPVLAADKDYELWLLPESGQPVSIGLLSETQSDQLDFDNLNFSGGVSMAVSLEPKGGSPTGQPTGDILYVAKVYPAG